MLKFSFDDIKWYKSPSQVSWLYMLPLTMLAAVYLGNQRGHQQTWQLKVLHSSCS